ncbi:MAG: DUF6320 domain-containing protein [Propionibacteriaceae bacterium]|jgi:hypothetical protein|nr:DUF6320 domain-containing protein [Propionibacteriaceae bacterium]
MKVEIVYPSPTRPPRRVRVIACAKWPFLATAYACPLINVATGWPAWSLVVLWGLWVVWSSTFSPQLIGINRISQCVKFVTDIVVALVLIDLLLAPGWAATVVPIVCFSSLVVVAVLFFTDLDRQRLNIMPMLALTVLCLISAGTILAAWRNVTRWPLIVLAALAGALLIATLVVLRRDFLRALRKFFDI